MSVIDILFERVSYYKVPYIKHRARSKSRIELDRLEHCMVVL